MSDRIPIIDLGPLDPSASPDHRQRTVNEIAAACRDWGFFQVIGHGVPADLIERVWNQTHGFFAMPREAKHEIARSSENPRGYYDRELTKNVRDLKEVFDYGYVLHPDLPDDHPLNRAAIDGANQWPEGRPEFKTTMLEFYQACEAVGRRVFEGFCLGLGLPRGALHPHFEPHTSFVRLNYYPLEDPLGADEAAEVTELGGMALQHHTDSGALTILLQDDVGGLQVYEVDHRGGDGAGRWIDVEPLEGAFVVNIGDMTQVWSNDRYKAALHRVRPMKRQARYSLPFFYNPSYETDCQPLPVADGEAPRYSPINWGDFRRARTAGDYADYGKEIQIADFRRDA